QLLDDRLVVHRRPPIDVDGAVGEMLREVGDVLGLAVREAAGAQARPVLREHVRGRDVADTGGEPVPDALRGLDRDLLADDRAREREERLAPRTQEDFRMRADDAPHHRIGLREPALRAQPVLGRRVRSGHRVHVCRIGRFTRRFCGFMRTTLASSIDRARYTGLPATSGSTVLASTKSMRKSARTRRMRPASTSSPRHSSLRMAVDSASSPTCHAHLRSSIARRPSTRTSTSKKCRTHFSTTRQKAWFAARPKFRLITKSWRWSRSQYIAAFSASSTSRFTVDSGVCASTMSRPRLPYAPPEACISTVSRSASMATPPSVFAFCSR